MPRTVCLSLSQSPASQLPSDYEIANKSETLLSFIYLCKSGTRQEKVMPPSAMVFISTCLMKTFDVFSLLSLQVQQTSCGLPRVSIK